MVTAVLNSAKRKVKEVSLTLQLCLDVKGSQCP